MIALFRQIGMLSLTCRDTDDAMFVRADAVTAVRSYGAGSKITVAGGGDVHVANTPAEIATALLKIAEPTMVAPC